MIKYTKHNLNRLEDIIFELGKQRKSLYLKAKRAEKYLEYTQKEKELKGLFTVSLSLTAREQSWNFLPMSFRSSTAGVPTEP